MSFVMLFFVCFFWGLYPNQSVQIWDENIMLLNNGSIAVIYLCWHMRGVCVCGVCVDCYLSSQS